MKIRKPQQISRRYLKMEIMELKNKTSILKSSLDELNNRLKMAEERIWEVEDRSIKINQSEQQIEKSLEKAE